MVDGIFLPYQYPCGNFPVMIGEPPTQSLPKFPKLYIESTTNLNDIVRSQRMQYVTLTEAAENVKPKAFICNCSFAGEHETKMLRGLKYPLNHNDLFAVGAFQNQGFNLQLQAAILILNQNVP